MAPAEPALFGEEKLSYEPEPELFGEPCADFGLLGEIKSFDVFGLSGSGAASRHVCPPCFTAPGSGKIELASVNSGGSAASTGGSQTSS
jgi:hypothetical protein